MEHMNPVMVDYRLRHTQTTAENVEDFVGESSILDDKLSKLVHKYTPEYHEDTIIELETKADKLEMEVKNEEKSQKERTYLEKREVKRDLEKSKKTFKELSDERDRRADEWGLKTVQLTENRAATFCQSQERSTRTAYNQGYIDRRLDLARQIRRARTSPPLPAVPQLLPSAASMTAELAEAGEIDDNFV